MHRANLLIAVMLLVLAALQYHLWFGGSGVMHSRALEAELAEQQRKNEHLEERNRLLAAEVVELKRGWETVEERARNDLGMIREDETLYLINE